MNNNLAYYDQPDLSLAEQLLEMLLAILGNPAFWLGFLAAVVLVLVFCWLRQRR